MSEVRPHELPTLREILRRPAFQGAEILAGHQGQDTTVRWVHVGEIPDIARYLHGQELILSTGVGLRLPQDRRRYLERLAECEVAGVCIELGRYLRHIPDDMLRLADRLGLPLVAFSSPVRFVDITRDVHSIILQGERQVLLSLQQLAADLRKLQGASAPEVEILERLSLWLRDAVIFLPASGEPLRSGPKGRLEPLEQKSKELIAALRSDPATLPDALLPDGSRIVSRLVAQQEGSAGLLAAACSSDLVAAGMALDLAASALAQAAPRARRLRTTAASPDDDLLIARLLAGREPLGLLADDLDRFRQSGRLPTQAMVFMLRGPAATSSPLAADLRLRLARQGLQALVGRHLGDLVLVLFDPAPLAHLRRLAEELRAIAQPSDAGTIRIGASARLPLGELRRGIKEAELALAAALWSQGETSPFYQELAVLRILGNLSEDFDLFAFVEDELGPLLAYDRHHRSDLLQTLGVLLQAQHKDEAAHRLRIRRQTLYYRIERIRSLLGEDFLRPERRSGLLMALLAHLRAQGHDYGHFVQDHDEDS